jgi:hypothetical protein
MLEPHPGKVADVLRSVLLLDSPRFLGDRLHPPKRASVHQIPPA